MSDETILDRITALVERERQLRGHRAHRSVDDQTDPDDVHAVEVELDQCWDLLRQRRAKREYGANPEDATSRSASVVESYWQ
ncbi:DUF2630 family protein [Micromonospora sp. NPDC049523]|uniref:DUF2630 family protein n=1 Tax=Micromonospora sp. NPDC049523 TaxID=3155921 RepID=UPI0034325C59